VQPPAVFCRMAFHGGTNIPTGTDQGRNEEKRDRLELALLLFSPSPPVKLIANAARQSLMRKMMKNGLTRMASTTIKVLSISISSYLIILLHSSVQMYKVCLCSLRGVRLPNPPLATAYELAFQAHSNCKVEYLTRYRSNLLLNLCYQEQAPSWENLLLGEW